MTVFAIKTSIITIETDVRRRPGHLILIFLLILFTKTILTQSRVIILALLDSAEIVIQIRVWRGSVEPPVTGVVGHNSIY
jgi:hypothetical protein